MKKITTLVLLVASLIFVAACTPTKYTVTFDSNGGSDVASVVVEKGKPVAEPLDPSRDPVGAEVYSFVGWFTDEAATVEYDFSKPVSGNLTLYAGWSLNKVLRFNTKTSASITPVVLGEDGGTVSAAPAEPTRDGYVFKGWFYGKAGLTWLEPQAVAFPLTLTASTTLYAYWEPVNSKLVNYSAGETYVSSVQKSTRVILNPLVYENTFEDGLIANMATSMYETEVDWDLAISQGVASKPGDFSKIVNKEYSVEALDYKYVKVGATQYPLNIDGDELLDEDGNYDRVAATQNKSTEWTIKMRDDIFFEDGTKVNAYTFEYTLKQYLDGKQNNFRANIMYKTVDNPNGYPILNAKEYFDGTVTWDQVGIKVIDEYTFKLVSPESDAMTQAQAVGLANTYLVHPTVYAASLDANGQNSTYGTPVRPYVSYGPYIIKSWDNEQRIVMNKNFNYLNKGTINYKSVVYEVVDNYDQTMALFAEGKLSVAGLLQAYYAQYAEADNVFKSWNNYPQYMVINTAKSKAPTNAHVHPTIIHDVKFRQALLYGFDRNYYANNVYAPNVPSLLPIPSNVKAYIQDPLTYNESPAHLAILEELGIPAATNGYIPDRAVALFDEAYAAWLLAGNSGPVTLRLIGADDTVSKSLHTYIKNSYETLFEKDGVKRLIISVNEYDSQGLTAQRSQWNFDLSLGSIGFGAVYGAQWQYGAIGLIGARIGGAGFGLSFPYDETTFDPAKPITAAPGSGWAAWGSEMIEVEMQATYDYLVEYGRENLIADGLEDYIYLLDNLEEELDEDGVTVLKEAGVFKMSVLDATVWAFSYDTPWDATAAQPFAGAREDVWAFVAALERVFFTKAVTMVPTTTGAVATIYAPNVVITWPEYSNAFGWGANRYRYLNTDPDFAA